VLVWIYAIWRWAASRTRQTELIFQSKHNDLSPKVHERLQEAIQKLANLAGQRSQSSEYIATNKLYSYLLQRTYRLIILQYDFQPRH
jgi:hypothetical protein